MALTAAESKELYQFFAVAFNAAPGVEYMNQLYDARNSGMTMEQVVEVFTTKTQFTNIYPNFLTNEAFATRLVDNVVGDAATAAAKAEAVADIVAALALGWSRGKTIYTIFGNLAAKSETDTTWGDTAKQFNNQVAVAQYYTETLLVNTTDVTKLQAVIANVTATTDVSSASAIENVIYSSGGTTDVASELTTTAGETVTGTPGNDVFAGTMGVNLQDGDAIRGGSGSDTLNLRANSSGVGITTLQSVETVNLNLRASATLDALNWSGTTTVAITTDSVLGTSGTITNADLGTTFAVNKSGATLEVSFADLGDDDDTALISVGAVGAQGATVTLNGALEAVTVTSTGGTGTLTLDASAETITVAGSGVLTIDMTNDVVSAISTEGFAGEVNVTVSAASVLVYSGGAADDTLTLATGTLTSADTLIGGAGEDTLVAQLDGAELTRTTGFEIGTFNVSADVSTTFAGFTTVTFQIGTSTTDIIASGLGNSEVNLNAEATDITLNYSGATLANIDLMFSSTFAGDDVTVSGATTVDFTAEATSAATITDLRINEATTINLAVVSGDLSVTGFSGRDATSVNFLTSGTGVDLAVATAGAGINVSGAESITIAANGSASTIDLGSIAVSGQGTTVTVTASGATSYVELVSLVASTGTDLVLDVDLAANTRFGSAGEDVQITGNGNGSITITVDAVGSGYAFIGSADAGTSGTINSVAFTMGASSTLVAGPISGITVGAISVDMGAEGSATVGTISARDGTVASVTLTNASSGHIAVGNITGTSGAIGPINASGGAEATFDLGAVTSVSGVGTIAVTLGSSADFDIGAIAAASASVDAITITAGVAGSANIASIDASGTFAGLVADIGASGDLTVGDITVDGVSAGTVGDLTVTLGQDADFSVGGVSSQFGIGDISVTAGASATVLLSAITSVSGAIGDVSITAGNGAVASGALTAALGVGDITISGSGTFDLDVTDSGSAGSVGTISILDGAKGSADFNYHSGTVGDITFAGHGFILDLGSAKSVGDITFEGGSAGSISIGAGAADVGEVTVGAHAGSGTIDFGNASGVQSVVTSGSGHTVLDFGTSLASGVEITAGGSGMTLYLNSALNGGVNLAPTVDVTLTDGAGTDIFVVASAEETGVSIRNFEFGSGGDVFLLSTAGFSLGLGSANSTTGSAQTTDDIDVIVVGTSAVTLTLDGTAATDMIVVVGTGFERVEDMLEALGSAGSLGVSAAGGFDAVTAGGQISILWYNTDETRTELTVVTASAGSDIDLIFSSGAASIVTIATFDDADLLTMSGGASFGQSGVSNLGIGG